MEITIVQRDEAGNTTRTSTQTVKRGYSPDQAIRNLQRAYNLDRTSFYIDGREV